MAALLEPVVVPAGPVVVAVEAADRSGCTGGAVVVCGVVMALICNARDEKSGTVQLRRVKRI